MISEFLWAHVFCRLRQAGRAERGALSTAGSAAEGSGLLPVFRMLCLVDGGGQTLQKSAGAFPNKGRPAGVGAGGSA